MIISWNWLNDYVPLDMPVEVLTERLMMAGLNVEGVEQVGDDVAIDLEVTSNRPDCLCHLGIARETGVLFDRQWTRPAARPPEKGPAAPSLTSVEIRAPELCPQYIARLVRGVTVRPSPDWMQRRLATLGIRPVNNVVDVTNYVLLECSQPLHAFDFDRLDGRKIIVRRAEKGERIAAIDQRVYDLSPEMCIIADGRRPVAIAGIMGGQETEIGPQTRNVLIEVAEFAPLAVRNAARRLGLHSDSSYRFERGVDRYQLDWASRRCAELILETAGGELCEGAVFAGTAPPADRPPIVLRLSQIPRILGIDVPQAEVERILLALGLEPAGTAQPGTMRVVPPTWRRDLTREADLIEEVARIHGYEKIPETAVVPLDVSTPSAHDEVRQRLADVLVGAGFFEAVTLSFVDEETAQLFRPLSDAPLLRVEHASRQRENVLRPSLVPSLLAARRLNERHKTYNAQLFEIARVYLAAEPGRPEAEPTILAFVSGRSFAEMKGIIEALVDAAKHRDRVTAKPAALAIFQPGRGCELLLGGRRLGWLGELGDEACRKLDLRPPVTVAEIDVGVIEAGADLTPRFTPISEYPAIERDLNFVLDDGVPWESVEALVREAAGPLLETVVFESQYRGPQIPPDKKSYVLTLRYRAPDRTLTAEEIDASQSAILAASRARVGAALR